MRSKIARLPFDVRNELNRRIENGEPGKVLVEWLNDQPETELMLNANFRGRAINAQNLSDWKAGGYQEWLAQKELRAEARQLRRQVAAAGERAPVHVAAGEYDEAAKS